MTDRSTLAAHIDRLAGVPVLCVGDVMLDRYTYGAVERISPEGPIPVLRTERETAMLGAAGNVVRNLVALGVHPTFVSVVGDDVAGREVTGLIAEIDDVEPYLAVARGRETTIKTRYIAGGQQLLRTDRESLTDLASTVVEDIHRMAVDAATEATAIILSDYGKGVLTPKLTASLIETASAAGIPIVIDPKGPDFERYSGATVITPNRSELELATGLPISDDADIVRAARQLMNTCRIDCVLVTRGQSGMTLIEGEGDPVRLTAEGREVFDVSGAGDTVVAMLGAALGAGVPLVDSAQLANTAAGIVVGKVGTAVASAAEIYGALHTQDLLSGETKVAGIGEAVGRVQRWRDNDRRIGFTNGVFDLLHPGHVSLLTHARKSCDRLVVGLNSDASSAKLKGPGRPLQHEASRAAVLASLANVDLVVIFNEDTPMRLIEAIRPDILVKGADYSLNEVVGADFVRSYGGKVLLAELVPGHSTTATISRMTK